MANDNPMTLLARLGVVPVIAIDRAEDAIPLADALLEGGLPIAEITFRTEAARAAIAAMSEARPELLVGAGTLLTASQVDAAVAAGARFGLAPGYDPAIVARAAELSLPFAPGVATPTDLTLASGQGIRVMKFFPAVPAGGPGFLQAIAAPFAHLGIRFIPTGGVTEATLADWLKLKAVIACGGTWIARTEDIRNGRFAGITARAKAAVAAAAIALEARG